MNKIINISSKLLLFSFIVTFVFCYEYSFNIGLISICFFLALCCLKIIKIIKKIKINKYIKIATCLFLLEIFNILSYIKILTLDYSVYSCSALSFFSKRTIFNLDKTLKLRELLTDKIINCNIPNGKLILIDNIKNNNIYDSSEKYKNLNYINKNIPIIEPLSGKSYNMLYNLSSLENKNILNKQYFKYYKKENKNGIEFITFNLFSTNNEEEKLTFLKIFNQNEK